MSNMEVVEGSLMVLENHVPDHFLDEDFMDVRTNKIHPGVFRHFYPSLGLLLKVRRGARHCCETSKRNRAYGRDLLKDTPELLWKLWHYFVWPWSFDSEKWSPDLLFAISDELRKKGPYINGFLETALGEHVLLPTTAAQGIIFDPKYIKMVMKYHENLERPDGTFDVVDTEAVAKEKAIERKLKLQELSELPRDVCESCMCRKQVYCGDCTGVRMKNAEDFLPKRINLPFNVLLLIDWHETLHKCTGVHAAALSMEGTVGVQKWLKSDRPDDHEDHESVISSGWAKVVQTFNYDRDVILFPSKDALSIQDLSWTEKTSATSGKKESSDDNNDRDYPLEDRLQEMSLLDNSERDQEKYRLILIESTWNGAKSIVNHVQKVRVALGLPPLRCVSLPESVSGLYWKLQHVGSSAVSTIEALTHAAKAAGCDPEEADKLLVLFFLQRYRLLNRIKSDGRPPRAVDVRGPWRRFKDQYSTST